MNWSYIAGFMDGEGCICLSGDRCKIGIAQGRKQSAVLYEMQDFLRKHGIHSWITLGNPTKGHTGNPVDNLCMSSRDSCQSFLRAIMPFSIVKRDKAIQALGLIAPKLATEADFNRRMALAVTAYQDGMSSLQIFKAYRIYHTPLKLHLSRIGITMRTRAEANRLHVSKRSPEAIASIRRAAMRENERRKEKRRMRLAGAESMYLNDVVPLHVIAEHFKTSMPTVRKYLVEAGVAIRPRSYRYS